MYPYGIVATCPPAVPDCKPGEYITRQRWGKVGGLSLDEQRSHFALWCIMASPLLLGNDPRSMSEDTLRILTAPELIAINQDALGLQGRPVSKCATPFCFPARCLHCAQCLSQAEIVLRGPNGAEVWRKPLADGSTALLLINTGSKAQDVTALWARDVEAPWDTSEGPCGDKHAECGGWAAGGECRRNREFMLKECPTSCPGACIEPPPPGDLVQLWAEVRDARAGLSLGRVADGITAWALPPHSSQVITVRMVAETDTTHNDGSSGEVVAPHTAVVTPAWHGGVGTVSPREAAVRSDDYLSDKEAASPLVRRLLALVALQTAAIAALLFSRCQQRGSGATKTPVAPLLPSNSNFKPQYGGARRAE